MCTILGCEVSRHLEIDHNIPVASGGLTELANLGRPSPHHHHDLKLVKTSAGTGRPDNNGW